MPRTKGAFIVRYDIHAPDLVLQSALPTLPPAQPQLSISERFSQYHQAHPEVYDRLLALAIADARAGQTVRVKRYFERIRYEVVAGLDNSFSSCYGLLLDQEPDLHGRVALRTRKAE